MPVGRSGRIVVEFDPELKRQLHARLRSEGRDFKGWLLERVQEYLAAPRESVGAPRHSEEPQPELGGDQGRVFGALPSDRRAGRCVDELMEATGLSVGKLHEALLQLEFQGRISQHLGRYRRV